MVSPRSLNMYMTAPQHTAAKIEKYFAFGGIVFTEDVALEAVW